LIMNLTCHRETCFTNENDTKHLTPVTNRQRHPIFVRVRQHAAADSSIIK
jgi:hypothetical protein